MIPYTYPTKARLKQFSSISEKLLMILFFLKAWSISNLRQQDMKKPGRTISPSPTILQATSPSPLRQGKDSLIGRSKFFATVTITSVPQTQKISQKNKAHNRKRPVLVVLKFILLRATIEKNTPKILFKAQCLVAKQKPTGIEAKIKQTILAFDRSNFLHQRISCKIVGIFQDPITLFIYSEKDRTSEAIPEIENTIEIEKYAFTNPIKMCLGRTLQRQQIPNKNAEATRGNLFASFILITASFYQRDLLKFATVPSFYFERRVAKKHPMQTHVHVLSRSCAKMGRRSREAAIFVARRQMQAGRTLLIGQRFVVISLNAVYYPNHVL